MPEMPAPYNQPPPEPTAPSQEKEGESGFEMYLQEKCGLTPEAAATSLQLRLRALALFGSHASPELKHGEYIESVETFSALFGDIIQSEDMLRETIKSTAFSNPRPGLTWDNVELFREPTTYVRRSKRVAENMLDRRLRSSDLETLPEDAARLCGMAIDSYQRNNEAHYRYPDFGQDIGSPVGNFIRAEWRGETFRIMSGILLQKEPDKNLSRVAGLVPGPEWEAFVLEATRLLGNELTQELPCPSPGAVDMGPNQMNVSTHLAEMLLALINHSVPHISQETYTEIDRILADQMSRRTDYTDRLLDKWRRISQQAPESTRGQSARSILEAIDRI